jgi:hypothetical protein
MALTFLQKKNVLDTVANFPKIAADEKWVSNYDSDTDTMMLGLSHMSKGVEKHYANDEFAFYFGKNGKVEGLFIEYFTSNFLKHSEAVVDLKKTLRKKLRSKRRIILQ